MNINDAIKALNSGGSIKMYIPSLKYAPLFRPMNTGLQKTLGRIALNSEDQYHSGMMRLALFEDLLLENTHEYKASMLKNVDMIAFQTQLKMQTSSMLPIEVICTKCGAQTKIIIDLKKLLDNCSNHEFKTFKVEIINNKKENQKYEFVLEEPSYMDILILSESVRKSQDILSDTVMEAQFYYVYSKLCLYVSEVRFNGDEITGNDGQKFNKLPIQDRLKFFDSIDQSITIDEDNKNSLINIIIDNFSDEALSEELFKNVYEVPKCTNPECDQMLEGVVTYDSFFQF